LEESTSASCRRWLSTPCEAFETWGHDDTRLCKSPRR
jgi:hypothetical protein